MSDIQFNSDMETAKKIKGNVLVWWPIVKMDDDGELTTSVDGGHWVVTQYVGNGWNEPDFLDAIGEFFGDDCCYAREPTHWLPVPKNILDRMAESALKAMESEPTP